MMQVFIFLFMNSVVAMSSFLLTYRLFRIPGFIDSLICGFILYLTQIVSIELFLGILGILSLKNTILFNLAILLIICATLRKRASSFNLNPVKDILSGPLINNRVILLGISVILCFGVVKFFINLVNPPFGWDSLNYHFTFPVEWLKHGNLDNPITVFDDPSPTYYPIGASLFFLWLIFPFKSVFLADVGQAPFFLLAILATYSICRKINLSSELSFYATILFSLIPNFFKQLQIAYVDVMLAALFLTCLNCLFWLNRVFSLRNVLLFSFSLALFLSIKTIALAYAVLLFLPFIIFALKKPRRLHLLLISLSIVLAIGGFSYLRSFIETGNPLYPLDFSLFGRPLLRGVMDANTYRAHFKIEDYRLSKVLFHEGLGLQSLLFILPSVFLALPVALMKKRRTLNFILTYLLILPVFIYIIYRYIIPLANTRYLYPLLGTGIILGFYVVKLLNVPKAFISTSVIICILASMAELAKRQELVISLMLTPILFVLFIILTKYKPKLPLKKSLLILAAPLFIIILCIILERDYIKNEYPRYIKMVKYSGFWPDAVRAWDWLNSETKGDNVAYAGRPVPFPLYGTKFKNNVYYVSVNKIDPPQLHYFHNSSYRWGYDFLSLHKNLEAQGNYRADADYSVWLNNLTRRNTGYLFIYSLHQTEAIMFPMEDGWAKADPGRFTPVFSNETIHIYKLIR